MDIKTNKKVSVGVFVIIGILLFIGIIYYIGSKQSLFTSNIEVGAKFHNVSGLQVGNNVRFSGIKIGVVKHIRLVNDSMANVLLSIEEEASRFINEDAVATIQTDGLMGNKLVSIDNNGYSGNGIADGDELMTTEPMEIAQVISSIQSTADQAASLTNNLTVISSRIKNSEGLLGKIISDTTMAIRVENIMLSLENTGTHTEVITGELMAASRAINNGDGLLTNLIYQESWSRDVGQTLDSIRLASSNLKQSTQELEIFMKKLNDDNGIVNQLLTDSTMAQDLGETLQNIERGTEDLDEVMNTVENSWLLNIFSGNNKKNKER